MNTKENILLPGGGGHCKSCIDVIEAEGKFTIAGILDVADKVGGEILGYPIIGTDEQIPALIRQGFSFLITVGHIKNPYIRINLFNELKKLNASLSVIVSPVAVVSRHSKIKEGTIIMHQAIINAGATISENCIINTNPLNLSGTDESVQFDAKKNYINPWHETKNLSSNEPDYANGFPLAENNNLFNQSGTDESVQFDAKKTTSTRGMKQNPSSNEPDYPNGFPLAENTNPFNLSGSDGSAQFDDKKTQRNPQHETKSIIE